MLTNPYESPTTDTAEASKRAASRPSILRTVLFGFGGAFLGFMFLTILANMESWQFYTIRSTLTGETAMSQITQHPVDRWIVFGLFVSFIFGGAFTGFWVRVATLANLPENRQQTCYNNRKWRITKRCTQVAGRPQISIKVFSRRLRDR